MKNLGSFTVGLVTGVILGAGAALLFAPGEGQNTRSRLSYQFSRLREQLQSRFLSKEDESLYNEAKDEAQELTKSTQQKAKQLQEDLNKVINESKNNTKKVSKEKSKDA